MTMHRETRPDGWRALVEREAERSAARRERRTMGRGSAAMEPRTAAGTSALARWENEGGPADPFGAPAVGGEGPATWDAVAARRTEPNGA